jgi:hypothetical protein
LYRYGAAKKVDARFSAQESRHRAEMRERGGAAAAAEERAEVAAVERDDANGALRQAVQR